MTTTSTNIPTTECILIYTDGSCFGNPGPGGCAAILRRCVGGDETKKLPLSKGTVKKTTNNRMELHGVILGLSKVGRDEPLPIIIRSDSQYVVQGMNEWRAGWVKRGWRYAQGKPVENADLWQRVIDLTDGRNVTFEWVRGHAGEAMNEEVDWLAKEACREAVQRK